MFQLSDSDKFVSVKDWQGTTLVHVRHHFQPEEGGPIIPTKKGVALTIDEWKALKRCVDEVDAQIAVVETNRNISNVNKIQQKSSWQGLAQPEQAKHFGTKPCSDEQTPDTISMQLAKIRKVTPYQRLQEAEPFDQ